MCSKWRTSSGKPESIPRTGLADLKVVLPAVQCSDLTHTPMAVPADAAIHITEAVEVQDAKPAPYCQVTGYVSPEVRFEVRLPLKTWTQRFVQTGCGGLCGNLNIRLGNDSGCAPAQNGELVLASTDMGHSGGMDVDWANGHPERVIDLPIAESMSRRWQPRRSPTLITAKNRNTLTSQAVRMGDGKR